MPAQLDDYLSLNRGGNPGDGDGGSYLVETARELLRLVPPPVLVERYSGNLDVAGDTNAVSTTYTWDANPAFDGFTYAAGVFTATRTLTAQIHPFIEVTNGTANNRNTFLAFIEISRAAGGVSVRSMPSAYIRDDSAAYDSGATTGSFSITFSVGDSFNVQTRRLDTQDATDVNPADISRSYLIVEEWVVDIPA